ncbi:HAD-IIB family hydrolase [Aurantimonas sp. VKM B-3413]|uniref:HAD-IIB family hydrolase n=1 Tax=Aurantimonas sp. VKM B-3413 TaxID=2779401 RepID=UPI001E4CEB1B|nr:HAD-IIB family hydrolase [Aurantimonas sp. VKM B-3413]MCB8839893.1 HAD-IIB family hydrolase [Aurantimonas sp. VKM B-3413]
MYFLALATDFDGTLAKDGVVVAETLDALERLKASGRRIILVTGRELPELRRIFPQMMMFDRVVAENGALLFDPQEGLEQLLAPPPPPSFVEMLRAKGVGPISVGRAVVATWEPHQGAVLEAIRESGLELQIVFNKGAIMILPPGVNKASGLEAALRDLELSPHNVAAVGDAENDHALFLASGCGAAVANAVPAVKRAADIALARDHGAGVAELADRLIGEDAALAPATRHGIRLGIDRHGRDVILTPFGGNVLIVGSSGSGKSSLAVALTERMAEKRFEFCVIDPEGDYVDLEHAVFIGTLRAPPPAAEALKLLRDDAVNLVVNTQALPLRDRRALTAMMLTQIGRLKDRTGRPHWLLIDEAHEVLPASADGEQVARMEGTNGTILVTAYPHALAPEALAGIAAVVVVGAPSDHALACLAAAGKSPPSELPEVGAGEVIFWRPASGEPPACVKVAVPVQVHRRHRGKYAVGDVGSFRSFYFRGPGKAMNTPARNLYRFLDMAAQVDDATWDHHLRAGDYSGWFRHVIKDEDLALETARIEGDRTLSPQESRRRVRKAVWRRYAAPAED